jgi:hypothetical protein
MSLFDDYPDLREGNSGMRPGSDVRRILAERARAFAARVAAMPRCRCGLLLPCVDCLPTNAVDFAAQRMYRRPTCVTGDDR